MNILEIILTGILILVGTSIVFRVLFKDSITKPYWTQQGYKSGYEDSQTNIRMYFSIYEKLPSTIWVVKQSGNTINTREKLLEATQELYE